MSVSSSYYWELVHNGGGDNSIGWVCKSQSGNDWERGGNSYVNGASDSTRDFWFNINQNFVPYSYADYVYRWSNLRPDFLMYDYYPFKSDGSFGSNYYSDMEIVRIMSMSAQIPFWTYIQSCSIPNDLRIPNANEIRYQIYTSLAYGCKGYSYFLYWTPTSGITNGLVSNNGMINTTLYNAARDTNAEVQKLGSALLSLNSQAVYHTGSLAAGTTVLPSSFFFKPTDTALPMIIGYFTNNAGRKFIMAVNRDFSSSRTITFTLNPKPSAITEISKSTGSEISTNYNSGTGLVSASFAPGEGKLFALPTGY